MPIWLQRQLPTGLVSFPYRGTGTEWSTRREGINDAGKVDKAGDAGKVGKARSGKAGNGGKASEAQPAKFFNHGKIGYCQITPSVYNTFLRTRKGAPRIGRFLGSSTAEHPAVNRRVVGSNPTRGAIFDIKPPIRRF